MITGYAKRKTQSTSKVNMVLNVHRNRKAYQGQGRGGKGVWRWGKREIIYLSLHCHRQNDSCIKMGSDESHFNVSLFVRDRVIRQCPENHNFWRERKVEADSNRGPSVYQPNALPLGQTGSVTTALRSAWHLYTYRWAVPVDGRGAAKRR